MRGGSDNAAATPTPRACSRPAASPDTLQPKQQRLRLCSEACICVGGGGEAIFRPEPAAADTVETGEE